VLYRNIARCRPEPVAPRGAVPPDTVPFGLRSADGRSQPRARAPLSTAHANLARVLTLPGVGETGPNAHWPCWAIEWGRKATKELRLLNCYRIFVLASFSYTIHVYTLTIHIKFSGKKLDIQLNTLEQKWAFP
jgi:hypothetical protein